MKILVSGTEGYIGSVLAPLLMQRGHEVTGVDTGFYKAGCLFNNLTSSPKTLHKDIRLISEEDLQGMEAIVHMAELSNDPTGQLSPTITDLINHMGSVRLATLAKARGVSRFVYTSSCSVYGVAENGLVHEESSLNPQTAYAVNKTRVEQDVKKLASDDFSPTFLRNATAFGASPHMRFDLVLNNLAGLAWTTRQIKLTSDGTPWRPLVHIRDICQAILMTLEAPRERIHNQIFNVGSTQTNYRVKEIAEIVESHFKGCTISLGQDGSDNRSYRVSFDKIHTVLPDFKCQWDASKGARELLDLFTRIDLSKETFLYRGFTRLKQLEYLLQTKQIDDSFFWRN